MACRRAGLIVVSTIACRAAHPNAPTAPAPAPPTVLDAAAIDAWVASELRSRNVVGASLVIIRDNKTLLAKGYGTRTIGKNEPIDADTPFAIGSVTKQFTCAAVMRLAEAGKLKLSDPVSTWYPSLTRASEITLDDLGAHLSGYRDVYPMDYKDARFEKEIAPDELLARYAGAALDFEPRRRRSYSSTGYVLLARIVEKVSGVALATFFDEQMFRPLGMTHTSAGAAPPNTATGHGAFMLGAPVPATLEAGGWLFGAGGMFSSANDLARWDLALSNGTVLGESSMAAMTASHHATDGRPYPYGCGLWIRVDKGERVLVHDGAQEGFQAVNAFVPRLHAAVILLANDTHVDLRDLHDRLLQLVIDPPIDVPSIAGPPAETTARVLVTELQQGAIDRSRLAEDFSGYLDHRRVQQIADQLRPMGTLRHVQMQSLRERGGMEKSELVLAFEHDTLVATMFRSPDGKIHQFLLSK